MITCFGKNYWIEILGVSLRSGLVIYTEPVEGLQVLAASCTQAGSRGLFVTIPNAICR